MKILLEKSQAELIVRYSRFLGYLFPIQETLQVRALLKSLRAQHPGASHVVHAFQVGLGGRSFNWGSSDDGEPPGCAGRPAYDVLQRFEGTNVLLGIVRYFGGVKLGKGGLVRAYSLIATLALNQATWQDYSPLWTCEVQLQYAEYHSLSKRIEKMNGNLEVHQFSGTIHCLVSLPEEKKQEFSCFLAQLTKGRLLV